MLLTEAKNLHMEHLEDNVLNGGVDGTRQTINFLRALRDMMGGRSKDAVNVSVKWDGSPAIFAGIDPADGKFFVAKKGLFNKTPKLYKTNADIDADISNSDLNNKFKVALRHLPDLGIEGIVQGDFLYTRDDLRQATIGGEKYITFHPNTIVYAVPVDSDLGRDIRRSKLGVVWHTKYVGASLDNMKAVFNQSFIDVMRSSKDVWFTDAIYRDVSGSASMTANETIEFTKLLSNIGSLFNRVDKKQFDYVSENADYLVRLKTFINTKVRDQQEVRDPGKFVAEFVQYLDAYFYGEMDKRKTPRGKEAVAIKMNAMKKNVDPESLIMIMQIYSLMIRAKKMMIEKLNKASMLDTFLLTDQGFQVTSQEGFVVADRLGNNAMKLVDRLEFSYSNFSPKVTKGWQR